MPNNRDYELNSEVEWHFDSPVPARRPVWILVEEDTCDPTQYPSIMFVIRENSGKIRLLDFDPEEQEEYLQTNRYSIIGWRYMTDHAGTWNEAIKDDPTFAEAQKLELTYELSSVKDD